MSWPILLLTLTPALAAPEEPLTQGEPVDAELTEPIAPVLLATVLAGEGSTIVLALTGPALWRSGEGVALFVDEQRADPRTGALVSGQRYAGDALVQWVGSGPEPLVEVVVHPAAALRTGDTLRLDRPRGLPPVAAWQPPPPPPVLEQPATGSPAPDTVAATPGRERAKADAGWALLGIDRDLDGSPLGSVHQRRRITASQALALSGGWSGDGYGSGLGSGGLTWRLRPARGPARVELSLLGLRGQRWVQAEDSHAEDGDEDQGTLLVEEDSREPAVGYWLWSRVDSPGIGLAAFGGLGGGVEAEGLALGLQLGLRTGHPDGSHLALDYQRWGRMGQRWTLQGEIALTGAQSPTRLSTGIRVRRGNLPVHAGDFAQDRSDGAVLLGLDPVPRLGLQLGLGLGGYDLLIADAGLVADGAVELRW